MLRMSVTRDVSQLRGWLKAAATCRGSQAQGTHAQAAAGGRREAAVDRGGARNVPGRGCDCSVWGGGEKEQRVGKHGAHARDAGGVPGGDVRVKVERADEEPAHVGHARDAPAGDGAVLAVAADALNSYSMTAVCREACRRRCCGRQPDGGEVGARTAATAARTAARARAAASLAATAAGWAWRARRGRRRRRRRRRRAGRGRRAASLLALCRERLLLCRAQVVVISSGSPEGRGTCRPSSSPVLARAPSSSAVQFSDHGKVSGESRPQRSSARTVASILAGRAPLNLERVFFFI